MSTRPRCPDCGRICVRHCYNPDCNWVRCSKRGVGCGYGVWTGEAWKQWAWWEMPKRSDTRAESEGS